MSNSLINKIGLYAKILKAFEIEELLFTDKNYIENNSYVSGDDNVNVFGLSEMKYFIKANDTSIDIQLRDIQEITKNKGIGYYKRKQFSNRIAFSFSINSFIDRE